MAKSPQVNAFVLNAEQSKLVRNVKADAKAFTEKGVSVWASVKAAALAGIPRETLAAECKEYWQALKAPVSVAYRALEAGKLDDASAYSETAAAVRTPRAAGAKKTADPASPAAAVRFEDGILAALMAARPVADGPVTWDVIRAALVKHDADEKARAAERRRGKGRAAAKAAAQAPSAPVAA